MGKLTEIYCLSLLRRIDFVGYKTMDKQRLFEDLLKKKGISFRDESHITKVNRNGHHPLSFSQQRIHFSQQFDPQSLAFNDITALHIEGDLNIEVLEKAFYLIIQRHEIMQMRFPIINGQPIQEYNKIDNLKISVISLEGELNTDYKKITEDYIKRNLSKPFDLANDVLFKIVLLKLSEHSFILVFSIHHIIFDGWSKGILLDELKKAYESLMKEIPCNLALCEVKHQYIDYVYWQKDWINKDIYQTHLEYWVKKLENAPQSIELPTDYQRPSIQTNNGSFQMLEISSPIYESIRDFVKKEQISLFMLLLAIFKLLLLQYTGQEDILIGSPAAYRGRSEFENLIGLFVNMIVLRTDLSGDPPFVDLLKRIKRETADAYNHQDVPFEKLIEKINPKRNLSYSPIFQVMFTFQNMDISDVNMTDLNVTPINIDCGFSQMDLSLTFWERNACLNGSFEYNTDLFTPETVERMMSHYKNLLEQIIKDPHKRLSQYTALTPNEKHQLIYGWNDTETVNDYNISIKELFEKNFIDKKDNVALINSENQIKYSELNEISNKIGWLLRKNNVKPDVPVGLCMYNSFEFAIGALAILKAGGAFVPIDPEYPSQHTKAIIEDSKIRTVITISSFKDKFSDSSNINIICLDSDLSIVKDESINDLDTICCGSDLACIIYTSGSTGKPKGVLIENKNIVNLLLSFIECYKPDKNDRILPISSVASASFVGELFPLLIVGGAVVLVDKSGVLNPVIFTSIIVKCGVTILSTVPSMLARLNSNDNNVLKKVRLVLSGGEALNYSDVDNLVKITDVVNGYGLTETSVCSTCFTLKNDIDTNTTNISVGKPIRNNKIYILDDNLNLMPIGCPGEIYVSGAGVSRGYLNDNELNKSKYLPNPFISGERMFKTGDKGLWLSNGNIKYIDRIDRQVQIHGFRVELGEIEKWLGEHPDIHDAVVVNYEITPNDVRLIAYFVSKSQSNITTSQLREWLNSRLPEHMVPSFFEQVDNIPVNSNGKIDIKKLPAPKLSRPELYADYEAPSNKIEATIAWIWRKYLHLDKVGIKDNFFDLGGHSLLVMQVCEELGVVLERKINIIDLFKYPTIYSFSEQKTSNDSFNEIKKRALKQREMLFNKNIQ